LVGAGRLARRTSTSTTTHAGRRRYTDHFRKRNKDRTKIQQDGWKKRRMDHHASWMDDHAWDIHTHGYICIGYR
jgi:hypothetical protein